jgi:hypothetical protein
MMPCLCLTILPITSICFVTLDSSSKSLSLFFLVQRCCDVFDFQMALTSVRLGTLYETRSFLLIRPEETPIRRRRRLQSIQRSMRCSKYGSPRASIHGTSSRPLRSRVLRRRLVSFPPLSCCVSRLVAFLPHHLELKLDVKRTTLEII